MVWLISDSDAFMIKNKMKNIKFIISIILLLSVTAFAGNVTKKEISRLALNWLKNNSLTLDFNVSNDYSVKEIKAVKFSGDVVAWAVNLSPQGFILISTDENSSPVIGYSGKGEIKSDFFSKDNFVYNFLIEKYKNHQRALSDNAIPEEVLRKNQSEWNIYLSDKFLPRRKGSPKEIYGPFLNSDWGQGYVNGEPLYNYYTPNNWPAGCVATAMAQILNYYKWPVRGLRSHGYTDNNTGYHFADFYNTFYDWANTLDQYENVLPTDAQRQAAGLLTYHTSVSVNMDFEANGSTASTSDAPYALKNYFRFSGHYKSSGSSGFWNELKNNMLDSRPGIISITGTGIGHAAVVDGYSETNNYYHVNPGWYGNYTGWYDISGNWNMSGYNTVVGAVKGIVPSPMINAEVERIDSLTFVLSWQRSVHENADYYQLQQATQFGGTYTTLSSSIPDSFYTVTVSNMRSYYYRVRAHRDGIWWDYSYPKKVTLGADLNVTFLVDMNGVNLESGDEVIIRGNIPPLSGSTNSAPMTDDDGDGVYELTLTFDFDDAGSQLIYRFGIQEPGNLVMESENRYYTLTMNEFQTIDTVAFNNFDSVNDNLHPEGFKLNQNCPNPFYVNGEGKGSGATTISYSIPNLNLTGGVSAYRVKLKVYDILGREVAVIVNKYQTAGNYSVIFNPSEYKAELPAGIYFYRLEAGRMSLTRKMMILK